MAKAVNKSRVVLLEPEGNYRPMLSDDAIIFDDDVEYVVEGFGLNEAQERSLD